jgi:hypothetical protein
MVGKDDPEQGEFLEVMAMAPVDCGLAERDVLRVTVNVAIYNRLNRNAQRPDPCIK